jgi:hypothetical protein
VGGTWTVATFWSGSFLMVRAGGAAEAAQLREGAGEERR